MTDLDTQAVIEKPLSEINAFDPAVIACPHAYNKKLRSEAPVHFDKNTGLYMVSNYDLVLEVIKKPEIFSSKFQQALEGGQAPSEKVKAILAEGWEAVDTMLTQDPPEQRRYRRLVDDAFSPRRVKALQPYCEALANDLVDQFIAKGECEFVSEFCIKLPLTVIADQLGIPREMMPTFKKWTTDFVVRLSGMATPEQEEDAARGIVEFQKYFAEKLEYYKQHPTDNIISNIANAAIENERPLDTKESLSILQQILVAGNETTTSAIAEGMYLLLNHPGQLTKLQQDPSLIPNFTEEILRLSTPTQNMWRITTQDTELGGVKIPKNSAVIIRFASANRDEVLFSDPDKLNICRENAAKHLAFGKGIHMCLGAQLAKMEMNTAFNVLLKRLKNLEIKYKGKQPEYPPNVLLRGMTELHITFSE
ncbi:MAG: cytochrome P450 [Pseudomonadales bacterium]|nr:cytochrome P450 [Pseudomonadales bacterium]